MTKAKPIKSQSENNVLSMWKSIRKMQKIKMNEDLKEVRINHSPLKLSAKYEYIQTQRSKKLGVHLK